MTTQELNQEMGYDEKSYLFGICQWLKDQPEAKEFDITDGRSIFYDTAMITYAKLIYRYYEENK